MSTSPDNARKVRDFYDAVPYPSADADAILNSKFLLLPPEWVNAAVRPERPILGSGSRALVAGCGTGAEAFALNRVAPGMEIVGIDFSENSIAIAQSLARQTRLRHVEFSCEDLTNEKLADEIGTYDFVSCHGVLDYIPDYAAAVRTLARLVKPDGCLYLGVNSTHHISTRFRAAMPSVGLDPLKFEDTAAVRKKIRALQYLLDHDTNPVLFRFHEATAGYLAGDMFGLVIHNEPMSTWLDLCAREGLKLVGASSSLQRVINLPSVEYFAGLLHLNRAELALADEALNPEGFHRLLFSPKVPESPPWTDPAALAAWRSLTQFWDTAALPRKPADRGLKDTVKVEMKGTLLTCTRELAWGTVEFLRRCDGHRSFGEITAEVGHVPEMPLLCSLFHMLFLNFLPPQS